MLLKEIELSPHTIWLLCAPSAQDVLPTIRSRTRIVNLAVPSNQAVGEILGIARFRAEYRGACGTIVGGAHRHREPVCQGRSAPPRTADELIVGVLGLHRASDAGAIGRQPHPQREGAGRSGSQRQSVRAEAHSRRINGPIEDRIPPKLRGAYNAIAKKDELKRRATRLTRDVLDRALNSVASIYRDVAVLQNNAEDAVGLINLENRSAITELSVRLDRTGAVRRLEDIATARRRLNGNGNPVLVFVALVLRADCDLVFHKLPVIRFAIHWRNTEESRTISCGASTTRGARTLPPGAAAVSAAPPAGPEASNRKHSDTIRSNGARTDVSRGMVVRAMAESW